LRGKKGTSKGGVREVSPFKGEGDCDGVIAGGKEFIQGRSEGLSIQMKDVEAIYVELLAAAR